MVNCAKKHFQGGQESTPKKLPETDAIFAQVKQRNEEAKVDEHVLRISIDAKATVRVGPFARGGKSCVPTKAADHDFQPVARVTPVGIFLTSSDELFLYGVTSKVTSDCLVDRLVDWWESVKERFAPITTLVINLDNGPESHSRRTQFMQRLVEFTQRSHLTIRLAYYPPYHSKYNPIERCWGILEQHSFHRSYSGYLISLTAPLEKGRVPTLSKSGTRCSFCHLELLLLCGP